MTEGAAYTYLDLSFESDHKIIDTLPHHPRRGPPEYQKVDFDKTEALNKCKVERTSRSIGET